MTEPTSTPADSAARPPAWFDLQALVPEALFGELVALVNEGASLEDQVRDFAVRCFRAVSQFDVAAVEALAAGDDPELVDQGVQLAGRYSGYTRLLDLVGVMVNHLNVARLETPCDDAPLSKAEDDEL